MSLLEGVFGKKKELIGQDVLHLLDTISIEREPVIVSTPTFKFVSEVIYHDSKVFQLRNNLTRDEVMYEVRGQNLLVHFPYELTLYAGTSSLLGLGLARQIHTLKFVVPELLKQDEHRGAYRVSSFPEKPAVTFTTNSTDIIKGNLLDLSMTGAGIRLDPRWGNTTIPNKAEMILDIRVNESLRISTHAYVRYVKGAKIGVQFDELSKESRDPLFKFIVRQRREEQRRLMETRDHVRTPAQPSAETQEQAAEKAAEKAKPIALIIADNPENRELLNGILNRKFNVVHCSNSVLDIRANLELKPNVVLMEIDSFDSERIAQIKKVAGIITGNVAIMFHGQNIYPEIRDRFRNFGDPNEIILQLDPAKKLLTFKQVQTYYEKKFGKNS